MQFGVFVLAVPPSGPFLSSPPSPFWVLAPISQRSRSSGRGVAGHERRSYCVSDFLREALVFRHWFRPKEVQLQSFTFSLTAWAQAGLLV